VDPVAAAAAAVLAVLEPVLAETDPSVVGCAAECVAVNVGVDVDVDAGVDAAVACGVDVCGRRMLLPSLWSKSG